ncbi:28S ribosomal S23, mitochondrial [Paramuricea clavata]|uniref:Small ribosomal subunit protein mS23 n=1 Tax=Paramuricea clavata TaxID=317549 RepID=A0A6S7KA23_PARCT|nr:28S ribosomal S23, mitochondrial [Paramuricea clavata]
MASSRHLKGTVLARVRDLLKSGVLKEKPIWFDVVATFPPMVEADFDRQPERGNVKRITFPEDSIRTRFLTEYESESCSLWQEAGNHSTCDRFVDKCMNLIGEGSNESQAFDQAVRLFKDELIPLQTRNSPGYEQK